MSSPDFNYDSDDTECNRISCQHLNIDYNFSTTNYECAKCEEEFILN